MAQGRVVRSVVAGFFVLMLGGTTSCATSFTGDAQFPGGALGCFKQCQKIGMEMATYVYVGEYSTACACKPKVAAASPQAASRSDIEGAVTAAGAGVELQRRRMADARQGSAWGQTTPFGPPLGPPPLGPTAPTPAVPRLAPP